MDWVIKKNVAELLIYIELDQYDLFHSRLKSFKRRYSDYLKQIEKVRILTFIKFAENYYTESEGITSTSFKAKLESAFEWTTVKEEDIFVISFYSWLKNKLDDRNLYQTTLKLINS